jgi:hypothetical protein
LRFALVFFLLVGGCGATKASQPGRTLPQPLVAADLPERPDAKAIPPGANWTVPCAGYLLEKDGEEEPELVKKPGVCMSTDKALRAARYLVAYDELRQLYVIDLKTWGRERQIYESHLVASEKETDRWREKAKRGWFEKHDGQIGLAAGLIIGAVVTVAIAAGTVKAVEAAKE